MHAVRLLAVVDVDQFLRQIGAADDFVLPQSQVIAGLHFPAVFFERVFEEGHGVLAQKLFHLRIGGEAVSLGGRFFGEDVGAGVGQGVTARRRSLERVCARIRQPRSGNPTSTTGRLSIKRFIRSLRA